MITLPIKIDWMALATLARQSQGLSMRDISRKTGVPKNTIKYWMNKGTNGSQPRLSNAVAVFNFYCTVLTEDQVKQCCVYDRGVA